MISFTQCDTQQSIEIQDYCDLYILKPDGNHIHVNYYDGYGRFSDDNGNWIDVTNLLAEMNISTEDYQRLSQNERQQVGCALTADVNLNGFYLAKDGRKAMCSACSTMHTSHALGFTANDFLFESYDDEHEIDGITTSINEHIDNGRLIEKPFEVKFPLKIASELMDYHKAPKSKVC